MKFKFIFVLFILFILLMINFVTAPGEICIDFDDPTAPSNLKVTSSGKNIILTWDSATDIPDCSGIDSYNIYIDGNLIGTTSSNTLTYTNEDVDYGTYSYSVYAVDRVSHNSGLAIKNDVVLSEPTDEEDTDDNGGDSSNGGGSTRVSGGGGGRSYVCYEKWECTEWSDCMGGLQTRTCTDTKKCGTTKLEPITSRSCGVEADGGEEEIILGTSTSDEDTGFFSKITGAVVGGGRGKYTIPLVFVVLIVVVGIGVYVKRK